MPTIHYSLIIACKHNAIEVAERSVIDKGTEVAKGSQ